jgi:hypothetical protein
MQEDKCTPTKDYSRLDISPNSKAKTCVLCCTVIVKADVRRKLFSSSQKTKACLSLELLLGVELDKHALLTEIICRNCFERNETLVKKIVQVRERYASPNAKLLSEKSTHYKKRLGIHDSYKQTCNGAENSGEIGASVIC